MQHPQTLAALPLGEHAIVTSVAGNGAMHDRLRDLGFCEKSEVACLFASAFGDPRAYRIKGAVIALRQKDAELILCSFGGAE